MNAARDYKGQAGQGRAAQALRKERQAERQKAKLARAADRLARANAKRDRKAALRKGGGR